MPLVGYRRPEGQLSNKPSAIRNRENRRNVTLQAEIHRIKTKYFNRMSRWKKKNPNASVEEYEQHQVRNNDESAAEIAELKASWAAYAEPEPSAGQPSPTASSYAVRDPATTSLGADDANDDHGDIIMGRPRKIPRDGRGRFAKTKPVELSSDDDSVFGYDQPHSSNNAQKQQQQQRPTSPPPLPQQKPPKHPRRRKKEPVWKIDGVVPPPRPARLPEDPRTKYAFHRNPNWNYTNNFEAQTIDLGYPASQQPTGQGQEQQQQEPQWESESPVENSAEQSQQEQWEPILPKHGDEGLFTLLSNAIAGEERQEQPALQVGTPIEDHSTKQQWESPVPIEDNQPIEYKKEHLQQGECLSNTVDPADLLATNRKALQGQYEPLPWETGMSIQNQPVVKEQRVTQMPSPWAFGTPGGTHPKGQRQVDSPWEPEEQPVEQQQNEAYPYKPASGPSDTLVAGEDPFWDEWSPAREQPSQPFEEQGPRWNLQDPNIANSWVAEAMEAEQNEVLSSNFIANTGWGLTQDPRQYKCQCYCKNELQHTARTQAAYESAKLPTHQGSMPQQETMPQWAPDPSSDQSPPSFFAAVNTRYDALFGGFLPVPPVSKPSSAPGLSPDVPQFDADDEEIDEDDFFDDELPPPLDHPMYWTPEDGDSYGYNQQPRNQEPWDPDAYQGPDSIMKPFETEPGIVNNDNDTLMGEYFPLDRPSGQGENGESYYNW